MAASQSAPPGPSADPSTAPPSNLKRKPSQKSKGHELGSIALKNPPFAYACLSLIASPPRKIDLDALTVRTYLSSALTQFLGLTGSAIAIDILKVERDECWIRVPREDLGAVVAAVGGWIGEEGSVAWRVRASGSWLGSLLAQREEEEVWK